MHALRVAVLVKQVPVAEALRLDGDLRLDRAGCALEMNPLCRRAVAQGVLLARESGGRCTVLTLGPPAAEDCLREAVACGADSGVLVTDGAFAGGDTLATARALAAALRRTGPYDLVLCGRNSVDSDTGQMPAQLAEMLGLPMAAGVRELSVSAGSISAQCEHDDGWLHIELAPPALLTCAERLIGPAKADPAERAGVPGDRIRVLDAAALGAGPWGDSASMTDVSAVRAIATPRRKLRCGADDAGVERAVAILSGLGAFGSTADQPVRAGRGVPPAGRVCVPTPVPTSMAEQDVVVLVEPGATPISRELLGRAAVLAAGSGRRVAAIGPAPLDGELGRWGADVLVPVVGSDDVQDVADAVAAWCDRHRPWAVLTPSTMWGREVAGRTAARLGAGLVGDATDVVLTESGAVPGGSPTLLCWKPACAGSVLAAVTHRSEPRLVTVREGALPTLLPREGGARAPIGEVTAQDGRRVRSRVRTFDDDTHGLTVAHTVVCVGAGVGPADYPLLTPLLERLGGELGATRKVTDRGWLPRARQIGVTGRGVAPRLYVAIGASGRFTNMVGAAGATAVLGLNSDPGAPVFDFVDVGIVADWHAVLPRLVAALDRLGVGPVPVMEGIA